MRSILLIALVCFILQGGWPCVYNETVIDEKHFADSIGMFYIAGWLAVCV